MGTYKGVDGTQYRELIQPVKITVTRAEGPTHLCGIVRTVCTFPEADTILFWNSRTAPESGGYDKHDFKIEFEDGAIYEGRYDLKHTSKDSCSLNTHIRGHLEYLRDNPQYVGTGLAREAERFLSTHYVGQSPVPVQGIQNVV